MWTLDPESDEILHNYEAPIVNRSVDACARMAASLRVEHRVRVMVNEDGERAVRCPRCDSRACRSAAVIEALDYLLAVVGSSA